MNVVGEMKLDEVCQQGLKKKIIIYICRYYYMDSNQQIDMKYNYVG